MLSNAALPDDDHWKSVSFFNRFLKGKDNADKFDLKDQNQKSCKMGNLVLFFTINYLLDNYFPCHLLFFTCTRVDNRHFHLVLSDTFILAV